MRYIVFLMLAAVTLLASVHLESAEAITPRTAKAVCGDMLCSEVTACPSGQIRDQIYRKCHPGSDGWKITGYFLPLERDYPLDRMVSAYVSGTRSDGSFDHMENNSTYYLKPFRETFLEEVAIQGSGKTGDGMILQSWQNDFVKPGNHTVRFYHYGECALTFTGVCLPATSSSLHEQIIMVAVTHGKTDMANGTIAHGTLLRIPDIPPPWNIRTYWAVDTGEWKDKHIDIFTGYGIAAREAAFKITMLPPAESSRVLAIDFKEAAP